MAKIYNIGDFTVQVKPEHYRQHLLFREEEPDEAGHAPREEGQIIKFGRTSGGEKP